MSSWKPSLDLSTVPEELILRRAAEIMAQRRIEQNPPSDDPAKIKHREKIARYRAKKKAAQQV